MTAAQAIQLLSVGLSVARELVSFLEHVQADVDESEASAEEIEQLRQLRRELAEETRRITPVPERSDST